MKKEINEALKNPNIQIEDFTILEELDLLKLEKLGYKEEEPYFSIAFQYAREKYKGLGHYPNTEKNDKRNKLSIAILNGKKYLAYYTGTEHASIIGEYIGTLRYQRKQQADDEWGLLGFQSEIPSDPKAKTETMHIHVYNYID